MLNSINNFKLGFSEIAKISPSEVEKVLQDHSKVTLSEMTIFDLLKYKGEVVRHGVYIFYSPENEPLYVGKNSAQSFVERIPWHFSLSDKSWMNGFVRGIRKFKELEKLAHTTDYAKKCKLLLIVDDCGISKKKLERTLRILLKPKFNSFKTIKNNFKYDTLEEILAG